jgi:hypothetical protein
MPLLDHFHPPLSTNHSWESFHSNWATRIADAVNAQLPAEFFAEEHTHFGRVEIDVATFEHERPAAHRNGSSVAVAEPRVWAPTTADVTVPAVFPDSFQVKVFNTTAGPTLVAVIELVSPGNKDRAEERRAFAVKSASYLHQGISLIIVDVVTNRGGNLHNETARTFSDDSRLMMTDADLYAVAYRPVLREERSEIDVWMHRLAVGQSLPTLPLRLTGDLFVPVDLESTYTEACRRRRLA